MPPKRALSSVRLPRSWNVEFKALRQSLPSRNLLIAALAPRLSMAKLVRYAAAQGALIVLNEEVGEDERQAVKRSINGPFDWSVALSFDFLHDQLPRVRAALGKQVTRFDEAAVTRALIAIGGYRLSGSLNRPRPKVPRAEGSYQPG